MARYTLAQAQEFLAQAASGYAACLSGSSYEYKGRKLTRQDLDSMKREMDFWSDYCSNLTAGKDPDCSIGIRQFTPVDC